MLEVIHIKNFRRGLATNSSSTHSIVYQRRDDLLKDLNIFETDYYGRHTETIAATKEAKMKYILAAVWLNEELSSLLLAKYPEMKQYLPLIKEQYKVNKEDNRRWDEFFGMYTRGRLDGKDPVFSYEYLCHVIENDELAIVGGSDEEDFVYDLLTNRKQYPIAEDAGYDFDYPFQKGGTFKNGNYYVAYGSISDRPAHYYKDSAKNKGEDRLPFKYGQGGRLRFTLDERAPIPKYPELIDLTITNVCEHGCPFCFMDSRQNQKHADFKELSIFINNLRIPTEFSIGGGNVILYPQFEELVDLLNAEKHIVNVTINVKDCEKILNDEKLLNIFENKIDGVGVSVFSGADAKTAIKFFKRINGVKEGKGNGSSYKHHQVYGCLHVIPEYIGVKKVLEIKHEKSQADWWFDILYLGYKENGRGVNCKHKTLTYNDLKEIFGQSYASIDTTFAQRYLGYFNDTFDTYLTVTLNEGEYSMYVDGTTMNAYKSSHDTEKPYFIGYDLDKKWDERRKGLRYDEAFAHIRVDNGFVEYKDDRHYWDL